MKFKLLLAAFLIVFATVTQAQQWISLTNLQPSNYIRAIAFVGDTTWIGTPSSGLAWSIDDTTWNVVDSSNSNFPDNEIADMILDNDCKFWVATDWGNVARKDGNDWTVYNSSNSILPPTTLILSITADHSNNIWVGFAIEGLFKFDGTTWTAYTTQLPNNWVRGLAADQNNNLWVATEAGAAKFDGTTWTTYTTGNTTLTNDYFNDVTIDSNNVVWFAGYLKSASFDGTTWIEYGQSVDSALYDEAKSITVDADNNKWFGMANNGIIKYDGTNWTVYDTSNTPQIPSYYVFDAVTSPCNDIWFGTFSGIAVYNDTITNCENVLTSCEEDTTGTTFTNGLVGNDFTISVFQNPSQNGLVELRCNVKTSGNYHLTLTDILGREVFAYVVSLKSGVTTLPIQLSTDGFYIATLRNETSAVGTKLILK